MIFQAMDAAGKDDTIKHVMSGVNPQGCQVFSFKKPSAKDLDHNFLWRYTRALPERGRIGIFNRSYYEEVLVVRVHLACRSKPNQQLLFRLHPDRQSPSLQDAHLPRPETLSDLGRRPAPANRWSPARPSCT